MRKPNIILINCDDLGYGDLGCYGSKVNKTPYIDFLCENGLKLTSFYMPSAVCTPSRGGMLTGCYPPRIGFSRFEQSGLGHVLMPGAPCGLSPKEETLGSLMKKAGYETGMVGKWHVGDQKEFLPRNHGFDFYFGIPHVHDMGRQKRIRYEKGKDPIVLPYLPPLPLMMNDTIVEQQPDLKTLTERFTARAIEFIHEKKEKPFFLYFAHIYTHRPLYVQDEYLKDSENGRYGAAVRCIDWSTGVLLQTLKELGLEKDTLILFTSDNGSRAGCPTIGDNEGVGSNAPLRGVKFSTYEGGFRMPMIAYWPGMIEPRVSDEMMTGMDFLPTFAHIAETELSGNVIDGMDMYDFLIGKSPSPRDEFVYYSYDSLYAIRKGDYKLHIAKMEKGERYGLPDFGIQDTCELYDVKQDPSESNELSKKYPEIVEELKQRAQEYKAILGDAHTGIEGKERRPVGWVENATYLTQYDETYPYTIAEYDLNEFG